MGSILNLFCANNLSRFVNVDPANGSKDMSNGFMFKLKPIV